MKRLYPRSKIKSTTNSKKFDTRYNCQKFDTRYNCQKFDTRYNCQKFDTICKSLNISSEEFELYNNSFTGTEFKSAKHLRSHLAYQLKKVLGHFENKFFYESKVKLTKVERNMIELLILVLRYSHENAKGTFICSSTNHTLSKAITSSLSNERSGETQLTRNFRRLKHLKLADFAHRKFNFGAKYLHRRTIKLNFSKIIRYVLSLLGKIKSEKGEFDIPTLSKLPMLYGKNFHRYLKLFRGVYESQFSHVFKYYSKKWGGFQGLKNLVCESFKNVSEAITEQKQKIPPDKFKKSKSGSVFDRIMNIRKSQPA